MIHQTLQRLLGGLAMVAVALAFAYPKQRGSPAALRIAHEAAVLSLDPTAASEAATQSVLSNFYEGLVAFDPDMRLVPALAAAWTTPDEHTWVFRLRDGVRFHDGSRLSASDVVFSLERARAHPGSRVKGQLLGVETVSALGGQNVRIVTAGADPLLVNRLAYVLITPRSSADGLAAHPVGTGPYRFLGRDAGGVDAEAFPHYWGGAPKVDHVRFIAIEDGNERVLALRERRVDVLRYVPPTLARSLDSAPGTRVLRRPGLTSVYLWLGAGAAARERPSPFADLRVRQALSLAIDRGAFSTSLDGMPTPANQLVAPGVFGHVPDAPELPHDPEGARRLLAAAGYRGGFETTLAYAEGAPAEATAASLVAEMLGRVGIRVRREPMRWPQMVEAWSEGRLPFFLSGWRFESGDALSFFQDCLRSRDASRGVGSFNPGFSDPRLDGLIDDSVGSVDRSDRLDSYRSLSGAAMERMPLVPLYHQQDIYAASAAVRWHPRLDAKLLAAEMSIATP